MIVGGGYLVDYSASVALGVNPSMASGSVVMDTSSGPDPGLSFGVGQYVVYSFGAASFYGIVSEIHGEARDPSSGTTYSFQVVDNRIRLQWQEVFFAMNMEDEEWSRRLGRPTAPAVPGDSDSHGSDNVDPSSGLDASGSVEGVGAVDAPDNSGSVRRRYWSILPQHWAAGIKTFHDEPFTAREILNFAFKGAWGDFGFSRNYHSALDSLILTNLDYTTGTKLANLISEINGKAGLEIAISGARSLIWYRKGEGLPPLPDSYSRDIRQGQSITTNDTKVRVVGERIRVQVCNVELEPDWKTGWEKFIDEVAWRREVASVFASEFDGIVNEKEKQALISARAKEITVWQYAHAKSDSDLLDYRSFERITRNHLPAWRYVQEFVFRSYRIPPDEKLYGIPLSSLEMADSLIASTDVSGDGDAAKQVYAENPVEFYPGVQSQVIHKGQPLDLLESRDARLFYRNARNLRNQWTKAAEVEVDAKNMAVRFPSPVFVDGLPSEGKSLYLKLNRGEGGGSDFTDQLDQNSDYLDVLVPNPDATIAAASVRASFCFLLGPFYKDFGVGPRRGALSVPGLGLHLLDVKGGIGGDFSGTAAFTTSHLTVPDAGGSSFREVLYQDGGKALDKAEQAAQSVIGLTAVQATGGFTRFGLIATSVSGVVDRVTVKVTMAGAVSEEVSYAKARPTEIALAERTLVRIQRTDELFSGQQENRKAVRDYRMIAAAARQGRRIPRSATHHKFADAFLKPIGAENPSVRVIYDKNSAAPSRQVDGSSVSGWRAGDIVWLDKDGWPSATGKAFGGVLVSTPKVTQQGPGVAESQSKELTVAIRGVVPVRIRGFIPAGETVMASRGQHYGASEGEVAVGSLTHGEDAPTLSGDTPELLALVNLGSGGPPSSNGPCYFGEIITWDDGSGSTPESKTGVRGGIIEAGQDQWLEAHHEVSVDQDREKLLWIEMDVIANTLDDGSVTLSGIKSANRDSLAWKEGDVSDGYPDKVIPPIFPPEGTTAGAGKIVLPIGKITVKSGSVKLDAASCGHFVINHCPGVLSYTRGHSGISSSV